MSKSGRRNDSKRDARIKYVTWSRRHLLTVIKLTHIIDRDGKCLLTSKLEEKT